MKCPICKIDMTEHAAYWVCSKPCGLCSQVPICKGCLEPCAATGSPIWDFYCNNPECPRTPQDNLRDLFLLSKGMLGKPAWETKFDQTFTDDWDNGAESRGGLKFVFRNNGDDTMSFALCEDIKNFIRNYVIGKV